MLVVVAVVVWFFLLSPSQSAPSGGQDTQSASVSGSDLAALADEARGKLASFYNVAYAAPDGALYAWGNNAYGQLGDGTTTDVTTPQKVEGLTNVAQATIYNATVAAVTGDGSLYMWGSNISGKLGDGSVEDRYTPQKVEGLPSVVDVAIAETCTAAVTSDGSLYVWGQSIADFNQGIPQRGSTPMKVEGISNAVEVATSFGFGFDILASDGTLYFVQYEKDGADGFEFEGWSCPPNVKAVYSSYGTAEGSLLLDENGDIYSRVKDEETGGYEFQKVVIEPEVDVIAMDDYCMTVVGSDGAVYTRNLLDEEQSGDAKTLKLEKVDGISNAIAATFGLPDPSSLGGDDISLSYVALTADGTLYGWGNNRDGQLGIGSTENQPTPVPIPIPS